MIDPTTPFMGQTVVYYAGGSGPIPAAGPMAGIVTKVLPAQPFRSPYVNLCAFSPDGHAFPALNVEFVPPLTAGRTDRYCLGAQGREG